MCEKAINLIFAGSFQGIYLEYIYLLKNLKGTSFFVVFKQQILNNMNMNY